MVSKLWSELLERRVPHVLAVYLGASWAFIEFAGFAEARYKLPPAITDGVLLSLAVLAPSIVLLAWNHGRRGPDSWRKRELAFYIANLVLLAVGLIRTLANPAPGVEAKAHADQIALAPAEVVEVADSAAGAKADADALEEALAGGEGVPACVLVPGPELPGDWPAKENWMGLALEYGVARALALDETIRVERPALMLSRDLRQMEIQPGDAMSRTIARRFAARRHCEHILRLVVEGTNASKFRVVVTLTKSADASPDAAGPSRAFDFEFDDVYTSLDAAGVWIRHEMGATGTPELRLTEALSPSTAVLRHFALGELAMWNSDLKTAGTEFEAALALDPNCRA